MEQIKLFKQAAANEYDFTLANRKMKFLWTSGFKQYISFITNCDMYLSENYFVIVPFQTFPFKAYHKPILLTANFDYVKTKFYFLDKYKPDKIIFKELLKDEIEIRYHEHHNKYQIRLKALKSEDKQNLDRIKSWCYTLPSQTP